MPADTPTPAPRCPTCNRPIDLDRVVRYRLADRVGCLGCGLQLVRRDDGGWEEIRG